MRFEFTSPTRIVFGTGSLGEAAPAAREFGPRALVVTGRDQSRAAPLLGHLAAEQVAVTIVSVGGEPTIDDVTAATARARAARCEVVIGFGGGSALDAAKAVAALLTNEGDLLDYLEVIGRGTPLARAGAPCITIPTTAGTGAEVTRNAVLASPSHNVKVSLRSPLMLPRFALVDPELTRNLSPALTASTGLDALTQLIEPYVSSRANPYTDALCLAGLRRAAPALRRAFHDGHDTVARTDLALGALYSGLALANSGLGAVHGLAGPIGGAFPAPHGAVCAALLPHVVAANLHAARARRPDRDIERRYAEVARALTGRADATADDAAPFLRDLVAELGIPSLRAYGLTAAHAPALVAQATKASSMKANPLPLTNDELTAILAQAL